jgi:hypothetical protein
MVITSYRQFNSSQINIHSAHVLVLAACFAKPTAMDVCAVQGAE